MQDLGAPAGEQLAQLSDELADPFFRWHVDPSTVARVTRYGRAVAVEHSLDRSGRPVDAPILLFVGPHEDLARLVPSTLERLGGLPGRVSIEAASAGLLPGDWRYSRRRSWTWLWTTEAPMPQPQQESVAELPADGAALAEVADLLARSNREGDGVPEYGTHAWLGVRDDGGRLTAVGAWSVLPTGVGHLRRIATVPELRGLGLGSAVTAELTIQGLRAGGGVCTLGVYAENLPAVRLYRRLGFRPGHTFTSCTLMRPAVRGGR